MQDAVGEAFLARLGGDEFAVIAPAGAQPHKAAMLAENLLAAFADEMVVNGQHLRVGLSVGVALFPNDGTDADALIAADAALYRAKVGGRGTVRFFEAEMDQRCASDGPCSSTCGPLSSATNSSSIFSRKRGREMNSLRSKRCCAGIIRCAASSRPASSSRWRRKAA
jgi:hypothetical protein